MSNEGKRPWQLTACVRTGRKRRFHLLKSPGRTPETYCGRQFDHTNWMTLLCDWIQGLGPEFTTYDRTLYFDGCKRCANAYKREAEARLKREEEAKRLKRKDVARKLDGITEVTYENMEETGITPGQFEAIFDRVRSGKK